MQLSQYEKILIIMFRDYKANNNSAKFWRASDFQKEQYGFFIGYEASPRMSELLKKYPFAFDKRINGKFREIRFRAEDVYNIYRFLPQKLRRHLVKERIIK